VSAATDGYAELIDAHAAQSARLTPATGDRWASRAAVFRLDPHRQLDDNTRTLAAYVEPGDMVLDIGGGAGRISLPLALRCRGAVNLEPSPAMREQFEASAAEAGITNARCIDARWPKDAAGMSGDVVIVANVTYFVREIVPFVEALNAAARRRVIIGVWSVPPPNHHAALWELFHGEKQAPLPGHRALLPVLWDMGLLPDVRVLPDQFPRWGVRPPTREEAVNYALASGSAGKLRGARATADEHFDELFAPSEAGFVPRWLPDVREMLITWET
jgi:hypothetical protein